MKVKKILALLLSFMLILSSIPATVSAEETVLPTYQVVANKTEAAIGDEITFIVQLTNYVDCAGVQFTIVLPEGLTLVENSFEELDFMRGWSGPADLTLTYVAAGTKMYSGDLFQIYQFKCTVNENATSEMTVKLTGTEVATIVDGTAGPVASGWDVENCTISVHIHNYAEWAYDDTNHWKKCSCGLVDETTKKEHTYTSETTPATCENDGKTVYTCECGRTYTETLTATGHKWETEGEVTTPATCTEKGVMTYECTVKGCTETKTEDIDPTGHNMETEGTVTTEPTCTEKGVRTYKCKNTGCTHTVTEDIDPTGHNMETEGTVTTEPTCTEKGVRTYKCKNTGCTHTVTEDIDPLGHDMETEGTVTTPATCEKDGVLTFKCKREGCTHTVTETIPATGHNMETEGTVTKAPTCEENGERTYKCLNEGCTHTVTEVIPALGHDYKITQVGNIITYECQREGCDHKYTEELADNVEVNVDENGNIVIVTENEDGTTTTEIRYPTGVKTIVTVDAKGNVLAAEVNVSPRAADNAIFNGVAAKIDLGDVDLSKVEVKITTNRETAVPVEIVVAGADYGYVVVIVDENGNETTVVMTKLTENGVLFAAQDGITIKVVDKAINFSDIKGNNWYNDAVDFVSARGIMTGMTANAFDATGKTTRAQVWTMLARLSGVDTTCTTGNWYDVARAWAMENGISDGTDANGQITREQLVTMLYRYAQMKGTAKSIAGFSDASDVSSWAKAAMEWAYGEGVMNGNADGTLNAKGATTRAEMAKFFMNFITR